MSKEKQTLDHADVDHGFYTEGHKKASKVIAITLISIIVITFILTLVGYKSWSTLAENRRLTKYPETTASALIDRKYFQQINKWVSDNQSFRTPLIAVNSFISLYLFGSAINGKTIVGKDGWYFYGFESMQDDFTRKRRLEGDQNYLRSLLVYLDELHEYGKQTDRQVLFMVAPNKHNIYPQNYADKYKFGKTPGTAEKIERWIANRYPSMFAPITKELQTAGRVGPVYYKTDTHWNYWGAKLAVEQIKRSVKLHSPDIPLAQNRDYVAKHRVFKKGNFAKLMGLPLSEQTSTPTPAFGWDANVDKKIQSQLSKNHLERRARKFAYMINEKLDKGKVMIIGDSFMFNMIPYAAEAFSQSLFLNPWGFPNKAKYRFPVALIEDFDPDVLVVSAVERRFIQCTITKSNSCDANVNGDLPNKVRQMRLKAKFDEGEFLANDIKPRKLKSQERYLIEFSPEKKKVPDGEIVVAKVKFPKGTKGKIKPFHKRLPLEVKHEQTSIDINPEQTSAYIVLNIGGSRFFSSVVIEGENIDASQLRLEVRHFEDTNSRDEFREVIRKPAAVKLSSLASELQD